MTRLSTSTRTVAALTTGIAGAALGLGVLAGPAVADSSPVVGHAYVNGNTIGTNTLIAFARHADGSETPLPGSPFAIGGAGLGRGLGSQGALQATADGRFLLAVDAGSNEISVLRVGPDGVPSLVGAPVSSGGVQPVSIALNEDGLVYVANVGDGGSNYSGFRLDPVGGLHAVPRSTVAVPEGSAVGDVLFNSTGDRLVGTRDDTDLIDSFVVRANGRLTPAVGSPFPAQDHGPIGAEFRPTNPDQLYVTNAHAGPGLASVSAFAVSATGVVAPIAAKYENGQTASCWVEITHDGRYLFAVNTGNATLSRYAIAADGTLTLLGSTPFTNGRGAVDARVSPDGSTLTVTGGSGHVLSTFAVSGGDLTELSSSPVALPAGGAPTGLVVL